LTIKSLYFILFIALLPLGCLANKVVDSLHAKATHSFEVGDYDKVLEYTLQALALTEKSPCAERANALLKVGRAYYHLQQKETALQYMKQTISIADSCGIDSFDRICYRQIGAIYFETGKKDSAKAALAIAERMLVNTKHWGELSSLYAITGELYLENAKGKEYFDLAEKYALQSGDTTMMAFANIKQGIYATYHKDCGKGELYFTKALELYRKTRLVEGEMYAMKTLAWSYSECGKAKETYDLLKRYQVIRDSIFKEETAEKTGRYQALYETEKKDRQNAELGLRLAKQVKDKRMLLAGFSIFTLLLIIAFLFIYSRYRLKKQKETDRQIAEQQQKSFAAVIEAEEKERKRIAGDLHDGIGQTMSAAKINLGVLQNEMQFLSDEQRSTFDKIVALVDESCREVRTVSHNMMPNTLLKSGLATAIRKFISRIDSKVLSVEFYSDGLDASLSSEYEVVLYRVIQECVNNVIKHSGAARLHISLIKDEDGIAITIEDNGKGFDMAQMETFEGIGLKNIQSRIGYLKGTVEWSSAPDKGTAVVINIPLSGN
jgi:two-component system, NarL family, sensor kinase